MMDAFIIETEGVRDLAPLVLDEAGELRVMPASFWASTTKGERTLFGLSHGIYSFPTVELVERLKRLIDGRRAIEIGAGHGALAKALGIVATDSYQQELTEYAQWLRAMGQPPVRYGSHVERLDAQNAVRAYEPQVVIGCWVTHRYESWRHEAGGNEAGIDEEWILANCEHYAMVGNTWTHRRKPILALPHEIEYPPFVYSRANSDLKDFIAVWKGARA